MTQFCRDVPPKQRQATNIFGSTHSHKISGTSRMKLNKSRVERVLRPTPGKVPDDFGVFGKRIPVPQYNFNFPKPTRTEAYRNIRRAKRRLSTDG